MLMKNGTNVDFRKAQGADFELRDHRLERKSLHPVSSPIFTTLWDHWNSYVVENQRAKRIDNNITFIGTMKYGIGNIDRNS